MRSQSAYTFIELMVALSIGATLAALTTPTFLELRSATLSRDNQRGARTLLSLARTSAISRQSLVTVCLVNEQGECQAQSQGTVTAAAFIDEDSNRQRNADEALLHQRRFDEGQFRWRASLGRSYLTFRPSGRTRENGSLYYCPQNNNTRQAWVMVVNRVGRIYHTYDSNRDGIAEDRMGDNLACPL